MISVAWCVERVKHSWKGFVGYFWSVLMCCLACRYHAPHGNIGRSFVGVVVWKKSVSQRLRYLNTYLVMPAGMVMEPLGGRALLEKVQQWKKALRLHSLTVLPVCCLVPAALTSISTWTCFTSVNGRQKWERWWVLHLSVISNADTGREQRTSQRRVLTPWSCY